MNQLIVNDAVTMSSREIADLVQSKHSDVKRSAERLVAGGVLTAPLAQFDFEHNGNVYQEYRFNKRDSLVVVARLSPEFTAAVVDRWQELEEGRNISVPRSLPEALRLAADLAEQKEQLTLQLAAAAPKVEFVDRYCSASGSLSFRQVAKLLKAKETEFRLFLIENDIMYRLGGALTPRHQHIDAGRFEVKTGTSTTSNHAFSQARFTAKGVKWIGGLWAEHIAKGNAA
ncbi:phage antirepressor KilAC domain-containing protein [Citrobacter freundii]|uniref:phage antirepressor KilAC domain-containing protein n=1 Tax=Citrobacter freundii TaxID=546 RepID=UPI0018FF6CC9|nr:DNA-binding protein [Citrobacter freundii]MBJ9313106.1 phage antirepressor KilAC domain-containing protein [Citrobacter freundii]HEI8943225.1 phage antirepressor KilAC domain-containing protein [Citrobacter freundii]HEJ0170268.1 phage antirepressor KilAC domain-containing protein [Citrobacter freundii]